MIKSSSSKKVSLSHERRRSPRIPTRPLHKVFLEFDDGNAVVTVSNISIGGLGFTSEQYPKILKVGEKFKSKLNIGETAFDLTLEVLSSSGICACRFISPPATLQTEIERYFQVELAALKFTKLELKSKNKDQDQMVLYNGPNNCELLINSENDRITDFSIILFGNYLEANASGEFTFGEQINSNLPAAKGVSLFQTTESIGQKFVQNALRLIESMNCTTPEEKSFITGILKDYQMRHKNDKESAS